MQNRFFKDEIRFLRSSPLPASSQLIISLPLKLYIFPPPSHFYCFSSSSSFKNVVEEERKENLSHRLNHLKVIHGLILMWFLHILLMRYAKDYNIIGVNVSLAGLWVCPAKRKKPDPSTLVTRHTTGKIWRYTAPLRGLFYCFIF